MTTTRTPPGRETGFLSGRTQASPQEEPGEADNPSGKRLNKQEEWEERHTRAAKAASGGMVRSVARKLGVTARSLREIGIGFENFAATFPMRAADGRCVGLRLRPLNDIHTKLSAPGSGLGLFIPSRGLTGSAELVAEGESNLAAALTLGYRAIATPGAGQCANEVVRFFASRPAACPCIVADADDPGQRGAERIARALTDAGTPCRLLVVPAEHGDLREWLKAEKLGPDVLPRAIEACPTCWPEGFAQGFLRLPHWIVRQGIVAKIRPTAWAVFVVIASFADADGRCWPKRQRVAQLVGVDVRTVDTCKNVLRSAGLLDWRRGGTGRANEYQVRLPPVFLRKALDKVGQAR
jgi:hypothetical protein